MWEIEYYENPNGNCPVKSFLLKKLSKEKDMPIVERHIRLLSEMGNNIDRSTVKPLGDGLFELRFETMTGNVRLIFFYCKEKKIVMTNGIVKKRGSVPRKLIDQAKKYRTEFQNR